MTRYENNSLGVLLQKKIHISFRLQKGTTLILPRITAALQTATLVPNFEYSIFLRQNLEL